MQVTISQAMMRCIHILVLVYHLIVVIKLYIIFQALGGLVHSADVRVDGPYVTACIFMRDVLTVCLLMPIVLIPFGALAYGFACFGKDRHLFLLSAVCSGSSCCLMACGLVMMIGAALGRCKAEGMPAEFVDVCLLCVEMGLAACLLLRTWSTMEFGYRATTEDHTEENSRV